MKQPLRALVVEDNAADAELLVRELRRAGFDPEWKCVETEADFLAELNQLPQIIFADYSMPQFNGMRAVDLLRESGLDIPFILVSGTVGEEIAVEAMKHGATDYLLKDRIARLGAAVRRALNEVEERAERRRLEAQFVEAQKMEVIGQLAGGVAHDFNNILSVILGYCEMIATDLGSGSPLQAYAEEIRQASERAVGLTRQLLVFSRKGTIQPIVLDVNDVLKDFDKMLHRLIDENIDLTIVRGKTLGHILADPGYVGQVLMNLVVNARDAMPEGGRLTIATDEITLGQNGPLAHPDAPAGDYVTLSVTDAGSGMTDEVKAHIFEAFFTTKPAGKGTGLGLATCQTIVHQCGGHIRVQSQLGKGTTFRIYFPRVEEEIEIAPASLLAGPLPRGTETLLVVEDDPTVRQLARRILEGQGYEVLSAANGRDGLHAVREHTGTPIRLVVTDVIMPLMNGKAMAEWLETTYADISILFTSGYADDAIAQHGVLEAGVAFLPKPYTPAALVRKVREVLDQALERQP